MRIHIPKSPKKVPDQYYCVNGHFTTATSDCAIRVLRACPPEDQAEVIHAISPISVKLGQIEGHTQ